LYKDSLLEFFMPRLSRKVASGVVPSIADCMLYSLLYSLPVIILSLVNAIINGGISAITEDLNLLIAADFIVGMTSLLKSYTYAVIRYIDATSKMLKHVGIEEQVVVNILRKNRLLFYSLFSALMIIIYTWFIFEGINYLYIYLLSGGSILLLISSLYIATVLAPVGAIFVSHAGSIMIYGVISFRYIRKRLGEILEAATELICSNGSCVENLITNIVKNNLFRRSAEDLYKTSTYIVFIGTTLWNINAAITIFVAYIVAGPSIYFFLGSIVLSAVAFIFLFTSLKEIRLFKDHIYAPKECIDYCISSSLGKLIEDNHRDRHLLEKVLLLDLMYRRYIAEQQRIPITASINKWIKLFVKIPLPFIVSLIMEYLNTFHSIKELIKILREVIEVM